MRYLLVFFFLASLQSASDAAVTSEENEAFNFLIKPLNLSEISSDYVVVNIWSPTCEPCQKEVSELNALIKSQNLKSDKISIIGLPIDGRKKEADEFIAHFKPQYKNIFLSTEIKSKLLKVGQIPFTMLFNKKRNLVQNWAGTIKADELTSAILKIEGK